ncbi:MAG: hypothetical protein CL840_05440 [Crocinitomicaceae bacterium]|nr:hypothetical protein [Crocinitomicaceae bacterium]|tara:strand:- start:20759 stop:21523 length:765 start_codon:yes stop_codon:yes gene_type:complete
MIQSIGIIGSGNVATNLALSSYEQGIKIEFIYSKTRNNQIELAEQVNAETPIDIDKLPETDAIFICVNDDQIESVSDQLSGKNALIVHCSGTVDINALNANKKRGVYYPFQSISKSSRTNWKKVPILIESNNENELDELKTLAEKFSDSVVHADSNQRKHLHLSGVLMNNFTNHLAVLSRKVLKDSQLPPELLNSILEDTVHKITTGNPEEIQTGPAIRNDEKTIVSQLQLLEHNKELKKLYQLFTESIQRTHS